MMKMGDRGFETPVICGDLWPVNFDVDLNLDPHNNNRKNNLASFCTSTNHVGAGIPYGEVQNMLLQRFDDFSEGDISQITDLTNSLPKGDAETGHACYGLLQNINGGHPADENSLFEPVHSVITEKPPLHPVDVYGRVTLYEGKLVIQLRHFNINTNYPMNIGECWLCREKLGNGTPIHSHKHALQGLFQVNDEFVQMDVNHYIIPEQALGPDQGDLRNINHSGMTCIGGKSTADSEIPMNEAISHRQQEVDMNIVNPGNFGMENQIILPMSDHHGSKSHPQNHQVTYSDANFNMLSTTHQPLNPSVQTAADALEELSNPVSKSKSLPPVTNGVQSIGNACTVTPEAVSLPINSMQLLFDSTDKSAASSSGPSDATDISVMNALPTASSDINNINSFQANTSFVSHRKNDDFIQHSLYEPNLSHRVPVDNCHSFFDNQNSYYSYEQQYDSQNISKFPAADTLSVSSASAVYETLNPSLDKNNSETGKRTETGARKRKSKAQKKQSSIKMKEDSKEYDKSISNIQLSNTTPILGNPSDTLEEWFQKTLSDDSESQKKPETQSGQNVSSETTNVIGESPKNIHSTLASSNIPVTTVPLLNPGTVDAPNDIDKQMINSGQSNIISNAEKNTIVIEVSCQICRIEFKYLSEVKSHLMEHKLSPSFVFRCSRCLKSVSNIDKFIQHLRTHSKNHIPCKLCSGTFSKVDKLERHMETAHNSHNRRFKCNSCLKSFNRPDYLKAHLNIHAGKRYHCDICKKNFSSQYNLHVHKKNHAATKPFACELCDKSYPRKRFLVSHIAHVHENKKLKCDICLKLFARLDVLARHKAVHAAVKVTYDCELCGKKFTRKDRLKVHIATHQSAPKHKCTECPSTFRRRETLLKHLNIHKSKEQCNICLKFLPSVKLQKHLRGHETQIKVRFEREYLVSYKCDLCTKTFKSKDIMHRHILRTHYKSESKESKNTSIDREKKFFCEHCSKGFTRSCTLSAHLKTHSKGSEDEEILADLPTVLNATKNRSKKKNFSYIDLNENSSKNIVHRESCISNQIQCISLTKDANSSTFSLPPDDGLASVSTCHAGTYNPHMCELPISTSNFCTSSPNSPINLSTEAITAAAYLLAHPFYEGPY